jgi:hypothetical protein
MTRLLAAWLLALACTVAIAQPGAAAKVKRLALVIGNGAYREAPLPNPLNDASDVAKALEASGFTVIKRENASLRDMHLALREFGDRLDRQGTGLFYFAGHGMQVRGRNYLIPVDADIAREDEVAYSALDLNAVMEKIDSAKNPVNIVILDACRNNPFGTRVQATAKGLAQVDAPPGTLIAFATAPGSTAADGMGRNGLYTQHLVKHLQRPGLAIEEVFKAVRAGVRTDSKNQQIPWESTSLESAFTFRRAEAPKPAAPVASAAPAKRAVPSSPGAPPVFSVGDQWTYRVVNELDQTERRSVVRIDAIKGDEVYYGNGAVGDLVGNFTRIVRSSGQVESLNPSNQFYLFPMRVGASWTVHSVREFDKRTFELDVKITVQAEEEIDTPLGKMRAMRVLRESQWKQRGTENHGQSTWTYWYNAGIKRYVRAEALDTTSKGKVLQRERWEMVSAALK